MSSTDFKVQPLELNASLDLGIDVTGITLTPKKVSLKGFNGLKNGVTVNAFDLPSNDPAGGIHLTLETTVTNVRIFIFIEPDVY